MLEFQFRIEYEAPNENKTEEDGKNEGKNQGKPQVKFSYRAETDQKPMSYSDNNAKQIQQWGNDTAANINPFAAWIPAVGVVFFFFSLLFHFFSAYIPIHDIAFSIYI